MSIKMQHQSMMSVASKVTKLMFHEQTRRYHGRCPFCHSETETFCADNKNAVFYCYACGRHGTKEDFGIMTGMTDPVPEKDVEEADMVEIHEAAAAFFYEHLYDRKGKDALQYMKNRGYTEQALTNFGIGYAPNSYTDLYQYLIKHFDEDAVMRSGLVKTGRNGKPYDMFRNRIMFPIMNRNGRVVAFGGRALEDHGPKYLNSPESKSFAKHKILYGFPTAVAAAEQNREIVICEGYMDLCALQAGGVLNSAAVLGTALTKDHAALIRASYKQVVLALDSDGPGIKAATRSIPILEEAGLSVTVMNCAPAKDPDEFIKQYGAKAFMEKARQTLDSDIFLVRTAEDPEEEFIRQILKRQV